MSSDFPQPSSDRAQIAGLLERVGVKPTSQRLRIAEVLMRSPCHLTAEQILTGVRRGGDRVSKATVYNTLKLLVDAGLIRQIHLQADRCVYDSTRAEHHHFHDVGTGELIDIRPEDVAFARLPALPEGTELAGVEVVLRIRRKPA